MFFGIDRGGITAVLYCSDWFVVLHVDLTWSQVPIVQLGVQVWHLSWALRNHAKWLKVVLKIARDILCGHVLLCCPKEIQVYMVCILHIIVSSGWGASCWSETPPHPLRSPLVDARTPAGVIQQEHEWMIFLNSRLKRSLVAEDRIIALIWSWTWATTLWCSAADQSELSPITLLYPTAWSQRWYKQFYTVLRSKSRVSPW